MIESLLRSLRTKCRELAPGRANRLIALSALRARNLRRCSPERGQSDLKSRSTFRTVVAGDLPLVILHHAVGSAEPEAGAFADGLGGIERIEDPLGITQAGSGIGEFDHDFVALVPE